MPNMTARTDLISLLLLLFLAGVTSACAAPAEDASPSVSSGAPTSAPTSPTATPAATGPPNATPDPTTAALADGWERVLSVASEGQHVIARDVVGGSSGYLTVTEAFVGQEGGPSLQDRRFWYSSNGRRWEEVPPPIEIGEPLYAVSTTADGDFLLVAGAPLDEPGATRTIVRRSADGVTWYDVESGLPDNLHVSSLDRGTRGWLLVGGTFEPSDHGLEGAWLSADGVQWERVLDIEAGAEWIYAEDGDAGTEGFVVAGIHTHGDGSWEHFAQASADGREWIDAERTPFGPTDPDFQPTPFVAPLGADWIVALHERDGSIEFWRSANGLEWRDAGRIPSVGELNYWAPVMEEVAGRLWFSTAGASVFPMVDDRGIWTSTDGQTWEPISVGVDGYLGGVATDDGATVLSVTHYRDDGTTEVGLWIGPAE